MIDQPKKVRGANIDDLAHELWAAAQLTPSEGIEDGVNRIVDILKSSYDEEADHDKATGRGYERRNERDSHA